MSQMIPTVMQAAANTSTGTVPAKIRACELFVGETEDTGAKTGADAESVDSMEKLIALKPPAERANPGDESARVPPVRRRTAEPFPMECGSLCYRFPIFPYGRGVSDARFAAETSPVGRRQ
jgi:hypothetical protein